MNLSSGNSRLNVFNGKLTSRGLLSNFGRLSKEISSSPHARDESSSRPKSNTPARSTISSSRRSPRPESFRPPAQRLALNREPCCKPRSCPRGTTSLVLQRLFVALCNSSFRISFSDISYGEHYPCRALRWGKVCVSDTFSRLSEENEETAR